MQPLRRIVLVVNPTKPDAPVLADKMAALAEAAGAEVAVTEAFPLPLEALAEADFCVVIGGDGSILGVVAAAAHQNVPVMGVNVGTLGFMANFNAEEAVDAFQAILQGHYAVDERRLLLAVGRDGREVRALNDLVIKGYSSRLVRLEVLSEGKLVNHYFADGLIFSSPTGSTAYNLSAGGPIVHPEARAIVLTPINPHTLTNRSIVLDEERALDVHLGASPPPITVAADGVEVFTVDDFPLKVCVCAQQRVRLVQHRDYSHFYVLREKLRWTGDTPKRLG